LRLPAPNSGSHIIRKDEFAYHLHGTLNNAFTAPTDFELREYISGCVTRRNSEHSPGTARLQTQIDYIFVQAALFKPLPRIIRA